MAADMTRTEWRATMEDALRPFGWTCGPAFWERYHTDPWIFHLANAVERLTARVRELEKERTVDLYADPDWLAYWRALTEAQRVAVERVLAEFGGDAHGVCKATGMYYDENGGWDT